MNFIDAVNELRAGRVKEFERHEGSIVVIMFFDNYILQFKNRITNELTPEQAVISADLDADWQPIKEKEESLSDKLSPLGISCETVYFKYIVIEAVKKLKEKVKVLNKQGYLQIDYLIDAIDETFGPKLSGENK